MEDTIIIEPPDYPDKPYVFIKFQGILGADDFEDAIDKLAVYFLANYENTIADLSALEYINSYGLAFILKLLKKIQTAEKILLFLNPNHLITKLFHALEFEKKIIIKETFEDAVSYLQNNTRDSSDITLT
jgi:anti-anti-sigma factor